MKTRKVDRDITVPGLPAAKVMNIRPFDIQIENITPAKAAVYLKHNYNNRKTNERRLNLYAQQMREGKWRLTNQGISFTSQGALVDGQHRLTAVCMSGKTVEMLVIRGLNTDDRFVIDTGGGRTIGQGLKFYSVKNHTLIQGTLKLMGYFLDPQKANHYAGPMTVEDYMDWLHKYPWVETIVDASSSKSTRSIFPTPVRAAVAMAWPAAPEQMKEFLDTYILGANLEPRDPRLLLRNYVMASRTMLGDKYSGSHSQARMSLVRHSFAAIHKYLNGESSSRISESMESTSFFLKLHGVDVKELPAYMVTARKTKV
jgi:hypothetical protein